MPGRAGASPPQLVRKWAGLLSVTTRIYRCSDPGGREHRWTRATDRHRHQLPTQPRARSPDRAGCRRSSTASSSSHRSPGRAGRRPPHATRVPNGRHLVQERNRYSQERGYFRQGNIPLYGNKESGEVLQSCDKRDRNLDPLSCRVTMDADPTGPSFNPAGMLVAQRLSDGTR
jgi:hypothetical protein